MKKILTIVAELTVEDSYETEYMESLINTLKTDVESVFIDNDGDRECKVIRIDIT